MHIEEPSTLELLLRIIRHTTHEPGLRDDLWQEAMIHLWLTETRRPDQTRSWYLQSCKFHLQHYLASGRSVDAGKRRTGQVRFDMLDDGADEFTELVSTRHPVFVAVTSRELIASLSRQLLPLEKAVLDFLADGLGVRESGR